MGTGEGVDTIGVVGQLVNLVNLRAKSGIHHGSSWSRSGQLTGLGVSRDPWRPPCSSPARPRRFLSRDLLRGTRPHPAVASTCRRRFSHCCIVRPAPCAPTMQVAHMVSAMPPAAVAASLASERLFVMVLDASKPENVATHRRRGTRPLHGTLSGIHMNWLRTSSGCSSRRTSSASRFVQQVNGAKLFNTSRRTSSRSQWAPSTSRAFIGQYGAIAAAAATDAASAPRHADETGQQAGGIGLTSTGLQVAGVTGVAGRAGPATSVTIAQAVDAGRRPMANGPTRRGRLVGARRRQAGS